MTENIDSSQWLPRNSPVVNPYRMAQGDLDGVVRGQGAEAHIAHAQVQDFTILADLIRRGFLEEHHRAYGMCFLELQHAFTARLRYKANSIFLEGVMGAPIPSALAEALYLRTLRDITRIRARIIERACLHLAETDTACKIIQGINAYQESFDWLVRVTDDLRANLEALREQVEKELAAT
jgi:hypothetical protein